MVDVNPVNKNTTVSVNSSGSVSQIKTTTPQNYYDGLAKQWAIDEGLVQGIDYSSKHYAQESAKSAQNAQAYTEQVGNIKNEAVNEINATKNETTEIIQDISNATIQNINEIKDSAVAGIDTTKEETLSQIEKEAKEQLQNIQSAGFYMRDDKLYFIDSQGEEQEFKSGGAGAVMFDTKIADHILQGEEALGWALQGTYVTKEAYPDFYDKCLEEFANTEALPLTDVTSLQISSYTASSGWSNVANVLDGSKDTYATCGTSTDYIEFSFAIETALSSVVAIGQHIDNVARACNIAIYSVDSSGDETLLGSSSDVTTTGEYTATVSLNNVKVTKVRIKLTAGPKGEPTTTYKTRIKEITFVGEGVEKPVYYYKNPNGHRFYNIANKISFDEIYEQYGIADFYGIDEENERVFLPRDKQNKRILIEKKEPTETDPTWYNLYSDGWIEQGGKESTTNTTIYFVKPFKDLSYSFIDVPTGTGGNGYCWWRTQDKTISSINVHIVGTSSALFSNQLTWEAKGYVDDYPKFKEVFKYYCVGNTEVTSAITNVTEITESENDSNPLGSSFYFKDIQPNAGWLKSSGQWNDGNIYKTFYNWLVEEKTTNTLRTDIKDISESYTDYDYVLNQDEMTFRLPLLNGSEDLPSDRYEDLELKANKESYIAPANGWYILYKTSGAAGETLQLVNDTTANRFLTWSSAASKGYAFDIIAKRGDKVTAHYNFSGATKQFRFIYAKGNGDLYFKVANAVQNLEVLDAGKVLDGLADKISRQDCKAYIVETYQNGTSGYIIWSNGYCEQWGELVGNGATVTVTFAKTFSSKPQVFINFQYSANSAAYYFFINAWDITTTSFKNHTYTDYNTNWKASGYLAEGQY